HVRAVDLDRDRIEERSMRAARTQAPQIVLQRFDRAVPAAFGTGRVIFRRFSFLSSALPAASPPTVSTPSPARTRARLPGSRMLNTTIGIWLSRQSATALASITFRLSARTRS